MLPSPSLDFAYAETLGGAGFPRWSRKSRCCGVVIISRFLCLLCCPPQSAGQHRFSDPACDCGLLTACGALVPLVGARHDWPRHHKQYRPIPDWPPPPEPIRGQALGPGTAPGEEFLGRGRRFDRFLPELLRRLEELAALAQPCAFLGEFLRRWPCFFATVRNRTEGLCVRETFWRHRQWPSIKLPCATSAS